MVALALDGNGAAAAQRLKGECCCVPRILSNKTSIHFYMCPLPPSFNSRAPKPYATHTHHHLYLLNHRPVRAIPLRLIFPSASHVFFITTTTIIISSSNAFNN